MALPVYRATWRRVRLVVLARDAYRCQVKGRHCRGVASEVDHIVAWREGGSWYDLQNLRAAGHAMRSGGPPESDV